MSMLYCVKISVDMTGVTEHIAIVFNEDDAKTIGKTGVFDHYVIMNDKTPFALKSYN